MTELKLYYQKKTLLLKTQDTYFSDDDDDDEDDHHKKIVPVEVTLKDSVYIGPVRYGNEGLPIKFELTNKSVDHNQRVKIDPMSMYLKVRIKADATSDILVTWGPEDREGYVEPPLDPDEIVYTQVWECFTSFWSFCLVKLKFYDDDGDLLFTKYLHLDGETMDCGCGTVGTDEGWGKCYVYSEYRHKGKFVNYFDSFCSVDEIKRCLTQNDADDQEEEGKNEDEEHQRALQIKRNFTVVTVEAEFYVGEKVEREMSFVKKPKLEEASSAKNIKSVGGEDADIVFKLCETGETIKAHKEIVSAGSGMLKSMMESGMLETQTGEIPVSLDWVTMDIFEDFLTGLYGGWTLRNMEETHSDFDLQFNRLKLADYYQCPQLTDHIIGLIVGNSNTEFDMKSAIDTYLAGCHYGNGCLKYRALHWIDEQRCSWLLPTEEELREDVVKLLPNDLTKLDKDTLFNALKITITQDE